MNKNVALKTAGVIFAIIALLHLVRLITQFEVMFEGKPVPLWANAVGLIIAGSLAAWMFAAARGKNDV